MLDKLFSFLGFSLSTSAMVSLVRQGARALSWFFTLLACACPGIHGDPPDDLEQGIGRGVSRVLVLQSLERKDVAHAQGAGLALSPWQRSPVCVPAAHGATAPPGSL